MTELDMIRRAQMYMEKLSHGINPLDGTPVADGDLIRNGRMSRCFAFCCGGARQGRNEQRAAR